jgi:hypothetical protein
MWLDSIDMGRLSTPRYKYLQAFAGVPEVVSQMPQIGLLRAPGVKTYVARGIPGIKRELG